MQEQPGNTPSVSNIVAWSNVIMFNTIWTVFPANFYFESLTRRCMFTFYFGGHLSDAFQKWRTVIHTLMAAMQRQQVSTMTSPNISPESDCTFKLFRDQLVVFFIKSEARRCDDVTALCRIWFAVWKSCECCKTEEERITHLFHGCSYFYILERQTDFYSKSLKLVTLKSVTLLKKSIFFFCHFLLLLFCSVCVYWAGLTDCLYIYILTAAF